MLRLELGIRVQKGQKWKYHRCSYAQKIAKSNADGWSNWPRAGFFLTSQALQLVSCINLQRFAAAGHRSGYVGMQCGRWTVGVWTGGGPSHDADEIL